MWNKHVSRIDHTLSEPKTGFLCHCFIHLFLRRRKHLSNRNPICLIFRFETGIKHNKLLYF